MVEERKIFTIHNIIGGVCLGLLIFFVFSSISNNNISSGVTGFSITNPLKTCKLVDVPYQAVEEYYEPLKFEVVSAINDIFYRGFDVWAYSEVRVRNVDTETGTFTVKQNLDAFKHGQDTKTSSSYVMPGETKSF